MQTHNSRKNGHRIPVDDISMKDIESDLREIQNYGGGQSQRSKFEELSDNFEFPVDESRRFYGKNIQYSHGHKNDRMSSNFAPLKLRPHSGNVRNKIRDRPTGTGYGQQRTGAYNAQRKNDRIFPATNFGQLSRNGGAYAKNENSGMNELDFAKARYDIEDIKNELMKDAMLGNSEINAPFSPGAENTRANFKGLRNPPFPVGFETRQPEKPRVAQNRPAEFYNTKEVHGTANGQRRKGSKFYQDIYPNQDAISELDGPFRGKSEAPVDKDIMDKMMTYLQKKEPPRKYRRPQTDAMRWNPPAYNRDNLHIRSDERWQAPEPGPRETDISEALALLKKPTEGEPRAVNDDNGISRNLASTKAVVTDGRSPPLPPSESVRDFPEKSSALDAELASIHGIGQGESRQRTQEKKKTPKTTKSGRTGKGRAGKTMSRKGKTKTGGHRKVKVANMVGYETINVNESSYPLLSPELLATGSEVRGQTRANSTLILDEGVDRVDLPKTDTSSWQRLIHGRRDIVLGGSVVAGVGILLIFFTIIYLIVNKRQRLAARNKNNSKLYKRLGTTDERASLRQRQQGGHSLFPLSTDEDDESSDEETVYNFLKKNSY